MDRKTPGGGFRSSFPILDWLPHYKSEWLRLDVIAALSAWALLVPQGIAYSAIAGVIAGVAVSLLLLIASDSRPPTRQMAYDRQNSFYEHVDHHPGAELIPGIVVAGIHGP